MSYIIADDILEQAAVVDQLTHSTSFLAMKSPTLMDFDLTTSAICVSSPRSP